MILGIAIEGNKLTANKLMRGITYIDRAQGGRGLNSHVYFYQLAWDSDVQEYYISEKVVHKH